MYNVYICLCFFNAGTVLVQFAFVQVLMRVRAQRRCRMLWEVSLRFCWTITTALCHFLVWHDPIRAWLLKQTCRRLVKLEFLTRRVARFARRWLFFWGGWGGVGISWRIALNLLCRPGLRLRTRRDCWWLEVHLPTSKFRSSFVVGRRLHLELWQRQRKHKGWKPKAWGWNRKMPLIRDCETWVAKPATKAWMRKPMATSWQPESPSFCSFLLKQARMGIARAADPQKSHKVTKRWKTWERCHLSPSVMTTLQLPTYTWHQAKSSSNQWKKWIEHEYDCVCYLSDSLLCERLRQVSSTPFQEFLIRFSRAICTQVARHGPQKSRESPAHHHASAVKSMRWSHCLVKSFVTPRQWNQ